MNESAAEIATATAFLRERSGIDLVRFVLFDERTRAAFSSALERQSQIS